MFVSRVPKASLEERLDPAFYAPLPLETDNWLDSMPEEELSRLGDCVRVRASAFYEGIADRYGDEGTPFVRVGDVRQGTLDLTGVVRLPAEVAENTDGLTAVDTPIILVTKGGSVGRVGLAFEGSRIVLSRDVLGLSLNDEADAARILFYLASSPGQAQVIRGASRQVQAHLTVERLKDVRIPVLQEPANEALAERLDRLKAARREYELAVEEFRKFESKVDPFASLAGREFYFSIPASEDLRARLDPAHYRGSHAAAVESAMSSGWRRLGSVESINREPPVWGRDAVARSATVTYLPLSSVEGGTGRFTRAQRLRVWETPSRGKWVCVRHLVLVPSLLESLNRVGMVTRELEDAIATSGFHALATESDWDASFVASYLTTSGAHNQVLRAGTGVRFRSYSRSQLEQLLLPPVDLEAEYVRHFEAVQRAAHRLESAWQVGVDLLLTAVGWSGSRATLDDESDPGDPEEEPA